LPSLADAAAVTEARKISFIGVSAVENVIASISGKHSNPSIMDI
jgi:hypothetical protein